MNQGQLISLPSSRTSRYGKMLAEPFIGDASLPATSEVVVIGGGIMGVATALYLAKRKVPVVVVEKAEIACEASSRAFGWVSELMVDPIKQPMTQLSKRLWRELQAELGELGFRSYGLTSIAESDEEMEMFSHWLDAAKDYISPNTTMFTNAQLAQRFPTLRGNYKGGIFSPTDGSCEPTISTTRLAEAARRAGARIVTDCAVRGIDKANGAIAGVFTEKGYIKTSTVVCAVNCWSRLFCGNLDIDIPQIYVTMSMARTAPTDGPVGAGGPMPWSWRRQIDGGYTLGGLIGVRVPVTRDALVLRSRMKPLMEMMGGGKLDFGRQAITDFLLPRRWDPRKTSPFEKVRMLTGTLDSHVPPTLLAGHTDAFSEMKGVRVTETWAGAIPVTPDNKPIISPIDEIPGFHVITACSYGISWAPAVGKLMSEIVTGEAPSFDWKPFRASRFKDGSLIVLAH